MTAPRILWITSGFPYGKGEQFIETELEHWAGSGARITFLPGTTEGTRRPVPEGFDVDDSLARAWASRAVQARAAAAAATDPALRAELADLRRRGALTPQRARTALRAVVQARIVAEVINQVVSQRGTFDLVYTYWLKPHTGGAVRVRDTGRVRQVISRAHSADLYEEKRPLHYNALVRTLVSGLDKLHVISELGRQYAVEQYGLEPGRTATARLGVDIPPETDMTPPGEGERVQLVSISTLSPIKRVDLMAQGIAELAKRCPERRFAWRHYGDGPLRATVEPEARALLEPMGVEVDFVGLMPHDEMLADLARPADLMLNTSLGEGVPVSIMEAQVRGIPCLATDVGATREVVGEQGDYLLPMELTPEQLAEQAAALLDRVRQPEERMARRQLVVERFDAQRNFPQFVRTVLGELA